MPARRDPGHDDLGDDLRHYLERGCWAESSPTRSEALELHLLAGFVLRGNVDGLRALWTEHGPAVKARHPATTFCEEMLAGRLHPIDTESWPPQFGVTRCPDHAGRCNAPSTTQHRRFAR